jgi:WD40 repeat protein
MIDVLSSKTIKTFENQNLDNVFQVDIKNNTILTAGQDRRAVVYNTQNNDAYYKSTTFLIYSAGLSPSAILGAIAYNEDNEISIFNTNTKKDLHILKENKTTLTNILFISETEVLTSSDDERINYYKID